MGRQSESDPQPGRQPSAARESRYGEGIRNSRAAQRAICIAVAPQEPDLAELRELLRTAGVAVVGELIQVRDKPHPDTYFGKGKLEELRQAALECRANVIACDDELSPRQERNIEEIAGLPVVDRTAVILDIFADHARSAEGKIQVELAQLEYNLTRMRGLWTHLERLGAGIGTRGPGESQIETDRRLARDRIIQLRRRVDQVRQSRSTQRRERERAGVPTVALVGYTNAGKSSILNALTGSQVKVRDRLFETLDPTTRSLEIDRREVVVTDTVGFIRKLPHQVVDAFSATLEEAGSADLLLHVVDAAQDEATLIEMIEAVERVLTELKLEERESLLVLNKADLLGADRREELGFRHPDGVVVSATNGEGLDSLKMRVATALSARMPLIDVLIPYSAGAILDEVHRRGAALERDDTAEGVRVKARVPADLARQLEVFTANGSGS